MPAQSRQEFRILSSEDRVAAAGVPRAVHGAAVTELPYLPARGPRSDIAACRDPRGDGGRRCPTATLGRLVATPCRWPEDPTRRGRVRRRTELRPCDTASPILRGHCSCLGGRAESARRPVCGWRDRARDGSLTTAQRLAVRPRSVRRASKRAVADSLTTRSARAARANFLARCAWSHHRWMCVTSPGQVPSPEGCRCTPREHSRSEAP
jgi:hypothetical protein